MKQAIIKCPAVWTELTQVGDGSTYFITNNGSNDIMYSVSDKPAENEEGFILPGKCQIAFSKVSKPMFVKNFKPAFICELAIEKYEPKEA